MIDLKVFPNIDPLSWDEFRKQYGTRSIALDGFVNEGPCWDSELIAANFNHHEGVDRLMTRATCAQVVIALRQGFIERFEEEGTVNATAYVNDCDEDVCLSVFALKHHYLIDRSVMSPLLNRLISMEDHMDTTAGAYPYPKDLPVLRELNWIFRPYRVFRQNGGLIRRNAGEFYSIISDVSHRILAHLTGKGEESDLDLRYKLYSNQRRWSMVIEEGLNAKTGMFSDGIKAYLSFRPSVENRYAYTIGRMSKFIDFDAERIIQELNKHDDAKWGGGDTIGGSNRAKGSKLSPDEVIEIVNSCLN